MKTLSLSLICALFSSWVSAQDLMGRVEWTRVAHLGFLVSGIIEQVLIRPGDTVTEDQPLMQLDARPFRIRLDKARAEITRLEPAHAEARRDFERARELYERTVSSDHELQQAAIEFARLDAAMRTARADLKQAELNHEYSRLRAPFQGVVLEVSGVTGEALNSHQSVRPVLVLADLDSGAVVVKLEPGQVKTLRPGLAASIEVAGRRHALELRQLVPADPGAGLPPLGILGNAEMDSSLATLVGRDVLVRFDEQ